MVHQRVRNSCAAFGSGYGSLPSMSLKCDRKSASAGASGEFLRALLQVPLRGVLLKSPMTPSSVYVLEQGYLLQTGLLSLPENMFCGRKLLTFR